MLETNKNNTITDSELFGIRNDNLKLTTFDNRILTTPGW
jgi:hypothetical protein